MIPDLLTHWLTGSIGAEETNASTTGLFDARTATWSRELLDGLDRAAKALLLPDLFAYWLTGELGSELTNASTTGLVDLATGRWDADLFHRIGVRPDLFPAVQAAGEERGRTQDGTLVTTVGSHDTASAVVAVPATTERFAYIASGTWSLVGLELPGPVATDAARLANFTNERGVDGRIRFLRNVGGLWLLQECLRTWRRDDLAALLAEATSVPSGGPLIDVDDAVFIPPGDMPDRIAVAAGGGRRTPAEIVRCILESLASGYARTLRAASELAGRAVDGVHVVGGGSQNALLCQLTADACGLPVIAGPVEATALGNVIVQARSAGALPASLEEVRAGIAASTGLQRYEPR
jgi:rhamnulokinase